MEEENRQKLLDIWRKLEMAERRTLVQFAEFIFSQQQQANPAVGVAEPVILPSPAGETAFKALKRLRQSYHMMEATTTLLDDAAQLMTQRILGTPDKEIIPKMESLFANHFQIWRRKET